LFIDEVIEAVKSQKDFDKEKFRLDALNFSKTWQNETTIYSSEPEGDTSSIAKELYNKYKRI